MSAYTWMKRAGLLAAAAGWLWTGAAPARAEPAGRGTYRPTWASVSRHRVPRWFDDAKLGIFIHWGLYSVPAFAPVPPNPEQFDPITAFATEAGIRNLPYAEWYFNSMQLLASPTQLHHLFTYGPNFGYLDFIPAFNAAAEQWDPDDWANRFEALGARYVVLVTRHHDGYSLWPSTAVNPHRGPDQQHSDRDVVDELTRAVRKRTGIRMGLYYSGGVDWSFGGSPVTNLLNLVHVTPQSEEYAAYADAQLRELIARYQPAVLWNDIASPARLDAAALFATYYNQVPDGVVNDRWGMLPGLFPPHYDFSTPEYRVPPRILPQKWETARAIGTSFAYNAQETAADMLSVERLVHLFVDIVSKNGNLVLGVGPAADGSIPPLQQERLDGLGQWLAVNGEAIFDTRPWSDFGFTGADGVTVRYTRKGSTLYAVLLSRPAGPVVILPGLRGRRRMAVTLLGHPEPLKWQQVRGALRITLPAGLPPSAADSLRLDPAPSPG